ncbi:MAG: glutamine synthetase III, partial [Clostridia bacterium]|nr:glutamine synthetase III [Clostridia bacterium]
MNVPEIFGENVFNDVVMRSTLPREVYKSLRNTIDAGETIDMTIADTVANAMKDWALSKGATHYTHWFQPLTNLTAEKHDGFIEPVGGDSVIMQLTGKSLIVGEPDASSFPSGGSRATCAARGYTAWDPTSPAFVKDGTLYIPTIFVSYTGETLDKKSPLLKSMTAIDKAAKRLLKLFGIEALKVNTTVGPEQEYFLVDEEVYKKREDLVLTGRTLFGNPAPKGQELDDHYFGALKQRVSDFMKDLDETLWRYGILSKSKHNEAAPAQHELAPIFTNMNLAVDTNQLTMELMKKVAQKHQLACLLHEKPFVGINGSGKHNNWSLSTTKLNLLDPGDRPEQNAMFMLILACIIKAVDKYQGVLRACVASASNDHRLGGGEAPPAILSVYLGDELGEIVDSIVLGKNYTPHKSARGSIGVPESPIFPIDSTDRNRTSPFAFTGNKFEFRMLGSSASVADPNIVLNTIVAEAFQEAAEKLEKAENFETALKAYTEKLLKKHHRIIFNYNGYGPEWEAEAARRGLLNLKTTADAVAELFKKENVDVFVRQGVYTKNEAIARAKIQLENYVKTIRVEALTAIDMATKQIYPAVSSYAAKLCENLAAKKALFSSLPYAEEEALIKTLVGANENMMTAVRKLESDLSDMAKDELEAAKRTAYVVVPDMDKVRKYADEA